MKHRSRFPRRIIAFSLIEVVLALGLISFALIAMIGLFSVGLKTGKESAEYTQAGNLASALLLNWRASSSASGFPLPALTNITAILTNSATVGIQGTTATNGLPASDIYNLRYKVSPGCTSHLVNVYLLLWWPVQAPGPSPGAYYETTSQIATP